MNVFVAKLGSSTTGDDLHQLFSEYGEVVSAKVIFDRETGNSKGFGFVEMKNDEEAYNAINELNEVEFGNSTIVVKKARPKTEGGSGNYNRRQGGGGYNSNRNRY
ncbi:MAG: RNA recognition motif domain-containing protein [Bacteroidales bacterium]